MCFNAARSIVCVETFIASRLVAERARFQCRTQHCVCRDIIKNYINNSLAESFNAARSIVCVETKDNVIIMANNTVSMPHAALCVSRPHGWNIATDW